MINKTGVIPLQFKRTHTREITFGSLLFNTFHHFACCEQSLFIVLRLLDVLYIDRRTRYMMINIENTFISIDRSMLARVERHLA